jgi:hypothetical protein
VGGVDWIFFLNLSIEIDCRTHFCSSWLKAHARAAAVQCLLLQFWCCWWRSVLRFILLELQRLQLQL